MTFAFGFGDSGFVQGRNAKVWTSSQHLQYKDIVTGVQVFDQFQEGVISSNLSSMACRRSPDLKIVSGRADGKIFVFTASLKSFRALSTVGSTKVTQLLWSSSDKYIVSGYSSGAIRIWNACDLSWASKHTTTNHSIDSLAFCADDTSVLVASGGKLSLYDIESASWVSDVGLPDDGKAVAFHQATSRLAVARGSVIKIFEMKPKSQVAPPPPNALPQQGAGSKPAIGPVPAGLAALNITNQVTRSKREPFEGLFNNIYRGELKTPEGSETSIAIKAFRAGFDPDSGKAERVRFEKVRWLLHVSCCQ